MLEVNHVHAVSCFVKYCFSGVMLGRNERDIVTDRPERIVVRIGLPREHASFAVQNASVLVLGTVMAHCSTSRFRKREAKHQYHHPYLGRKLNTEHYIPPIMG